MYPFKPFNKHFDYGFGGYADAFKRAADELISQRDAGHIFLNMHLPINYLYRHAIELYLKSLIIVVHRKLKLPFGANDSESLPRIFTDNKWIPIHRVHSIRELYEYFRKTLNEQAASIASLTNSDWSNPPAELDAQILLIDEFDSRSTFLRYPDIKNLDDEQEKSSFQESTLYEVFRRMAPGEEYSKAFLVMDEHNEIAETYQLNSAPMLELTEALKEVASLLESAHLGMRTEFSNGE